MAEPTLKDVLDAIAKLSGATKGELTELRRELVAKIEAHRAETAKGFADLDTELTKHARVHRELEKDIETVKRRPPRTAARTPRRR